MNSRVQENDDSFEFDTERTWVPTGCAWVSGSIMPEQQMGRLVRKSGVWDDKIQWSILVYIDERLLTHDLVFVVESC